MGKWQGAVESVAVTPSFWRGKRVFITGHTGFKGSWLALWLQQLGADVTGFALDPPSNPSLFEIANVDIAMRSFIADIRDLDATTSALIEVRPEIVFHLAAQSIVRISYKAPVETYATNVLGTVNLLEAIRETGTVRAVVNVTSDKCYENKEWYWGYRENDVVGGYDPYSNSKACAELVTAAYRSSFFNPSRYDEHGVAIASARAGNVIGGGDWATDRLIPDMVRAMSAGQIVGIRSPNAIRPWQHVLEPLSGYLLLAEKLYAEGPGYGDAWNFGPNDEDAKPVSWIANKFQEEWGGGAIWCTDSAEHPHESTCLRLDCAKAKSRLNWAPRWGLERTLKTIVSWHKAQLENKDMRSYCLSQIEDFSRRVTN